MRPAAERSRLASRAGRAFTLIELLVVIAILGILIAILIPAVQAARETARRSRCANNLRQIGLALASYHDALGSLPPAVADNRGNSPHVHPWSLLILPYLEQKPLYDQYDFEAGFNAPVNAGIVSQRLAVYLCPSADESEHANEAFGPSNYAANSGVEPVVNGGVMYPLSAVEFRQVVDGLSHTILVGEIYFHNLGWACGSAAGSAGGGGGGGGGEGYARGVSRWWRCAAPCAVAGINPPETDCFNRCERRHQFSSQHPGGAQFAYCDGHTAFVSDASDRDVLKAQMTIAGREANAAF